MDAAAGVRRRDRAIPRVTWTRLRSAGPDRPCRADHPNDDGRDQDSDSARDDHRRDEVKARVRLELARSADGRKWREEEGEQHAQERGRDGDHAGSRRAQRQQLRACHAQRTKGRVCGCLD